MSLLLPVLALFACRSPQLEPGWNFVEQDWDDYPPEVTDLHYRDGLWFALDKSGLVAVYDDGDRVGDFVIETFDPDDCGLVSMAFDPDFEDNRYVYFGTCVSTQASGVFRATLSASSTQISDVVEILVGEDPEAELPWHNVGWIGFDSEGYLLALFGEKTRKSNAQDTGNFLGSVVRIAPSREAGVGGHTPHPDNVFADGGGAPEIYAWGFRSPWQGDLDHTGQLWVADVGANEEGWEEVNAIAPGQNYGWPTHEGPCTNNCDDVTDPVFSWPHSGDHQYFSEDPDANPTTLRVSWVARGHRGGADPYDGRLSDRMLFGDTCVGFVRLTDLGEQDEHLGHMVGAASWEQGPEGYLHVSRLSSCLSERDEPESKVFRLEYVPTE